MAAETALDAKSVPADTAAEAREVAESTAADAAPVADSTTELTNGVMQSWLEQVICGTGLGEATMKGKSARVVAVMKFEVRMFDSVLAMWV